MRFAHLHHSALSSAQRSFVSGPRQQGTWVWRADSFRASEGQPMTVRRALALNAVLEHAPLQHTPGELLVGTGFPARLVPADTFPTERIEAAKALVQGIGERNFHSHANHHASDYPKLLRLGFGGLIAEVDAALPRQDAKGQTFLQSVRVALVGASAFCLRWAAALREAATGEFAELHAFQAGLLERLALDPPASFWEALQLTYLFHSLTQLDDRGAMAFGRLDQYLQPFHAADLAAGRLTREDAQDLLDHFFAKITITEDVQNITLAGTRPSDGSDASSELTLQILEACKRVGRPGGNCTVRVHPGTPQRVLEACAEVIRTGIGYPALANEAPIIEGLVEHGYTPEDARDYCCVGCIETQIPGKQAPWADGRANPLYMLNLALFRGQDSLTGKQIVPDPGEPASFAEFYQLFLHLAQQQIRDLVAVADRQQRAHFERREEFTSPLLSALVDDCIARGRDMNDGGARYPGCFGFASMGIASLADSLAAIRQLVYEERRFTLDHLRTMLHADFAGFEAEREILLRAVPKFGNDEDAVDLLAAAVVTDLAAEYSRHRTPEGGHYFMLLGANVQNISAGREVGATPDGRRAREPLSDAASPTFGRDLQGPTAAIRSTAKLPYRLCVGGNVVNMKLDPACLEGREGCARLAALVRASFALGGQELQFNTTGAKILRAARENPADHRHLVVRVSGFSATYVNLDPAVQNDILARTEHRLGNG
ncbi:MAG: pyruvate formate lyase family protein [Lentisphaeria bacterium]|jgi:formate C-acetyltransferase|nr:pyruvate formate lyase family protein [Lentisphaeria bacterium]